MDTRRDLADTGASVCATGMKEILHEFTSHTNYAIVGYDGASTHAAGQGMAHIRNPTTGLIDQMFFVYVPSITGTIVSLEHHAKTNPAIHRWTQEATPATNTGWVTFFDDREQVISRYPTMQEQGLVYYIQALQFVPAPMAQLNHLHGTPQMPTRTTHLLDDDLTVKTKTTSKTLNCVDFDHTLATDYMPMQMRQSQESQTPVCTALIGRKIEGIVARMDVWNTMETDVLNFETWHQRMAHCSEKRLRQTHKLVDGIPVFHTPKIPHIVKCRTCDVAKLRKAPRGPTADTSSSL